MLSNKSLGECLGELVRHSLDTYSKQACDDLSQRRTYPELKLEVENIKRQLLDHGLAKNDKVCLFTTKDCQSYAALLALVASDVCYIPLDPLAPIARVTAIVKDSCPAGILVDSTTSNIMAGEFNHGEFLPINGTSLIYISFDVKQPKQDHNDLAYVLYTSGSTGHPKGVLVTHENALSFINWAVTTFDVREEDTFSCVAPFHFDLSVFDLFVSLYIGANVVLFNDKHIRNPLLLAQQIEERQISVWYSTPTILVLLEQYGKLFKYTHATMRIVLYAGELMPVQRLKSIKENWLQADFFNLYGPTESNVVSWIKVDQNVTDHYDTALIGRPCDHVNMALLVNGKVEPLTVEQEGELLISGSAISPGYLNSKKVLNKKLIRDDGSYWYQTGDKVRVVNALNLKYLGRLDRMIKKNGYRIELDEIQNNLQQCKSIRRAAVISTLDQQNLPFIIAFYEILRDDDDRHIESLESINTLDELQLHIKGVLPNYMWPDRWVCLKNLPMTSTNKIDYNGLAVYGES